MASLLSTSPTTSAKSDREPITRNINTPQTKKPRTGLPSQMSLNQDLFVNPPSKTLDPQGICQRCGHSNAAHTNNFTCDDLEKRCQEHVTRLQEFRHRLRFQEQAERDIDGLVPMTLQKGCQSRAAKEYSSRSSAKSQAATNGGQGVFTSHVQRQPHQVGLHFQEKKELEQQARSGLANLESKTRRDAFEEAERLADAASTTNNVLPDEPQHYYSKRLLHPSQSKPSQSQDAALITQFSDSGSESNMDAIAERSINTTFKHIFIVLAHINTRQFVRSHLCIAEHCILEARAGLAQRQAKLQHLASKFDELERLTPASQRANLRCVKFKACQTIELEVEAVSSTLSKALAVVCELNALEKKSQKSVIDLDGKYAETRHLL